MRKSKVRTYLAISAAAAALGVAAVSATTASAAWTSSPTTYQLSVQAPLFGRVGNAVPSFSSLQVQVGNSKWCYAPSLNQLTGISNNEVYLTAPYKVVKGWTYTVSAWEGPKCDAYIPSLGRNARPVGGQVTTTVGTATSSAYRDGSTWHVVIPQP